VVIVFGKDSNAVGIQAVFQCDLCHLAVFGVDGGGDGNILVQIQIGQVKICGLGIGKILGGDEQGIEVILPRHDEIHGVGVDHIGADTAGKAHVAPLFVARKHGVMLLVLNGAKLKHLLPHVLAESFHCGDHGSVRRCVDERGEKGHHANGRKEEKRGRHGLDAKDHDKGGNHSDPRRRGDQPHVEKEQNSVFHSLLLMLNSFLNKMPVFLQKNGDFVKLCRE